MIENVKKDKKEETTAANLKVSKYKEKDVYVVKLNELFIEVKKQNKNG